MDKTLLAEEAECDCYYNMKNSWHVWPLQVAVQVWNEDDWRDMKAERQPGARSWRSWGHVLQSLDFCLENNAESLEHFKMKHEFNGFEM